jgi:hypothetical protein
MITFAARLTGRVLLITALALGLAGVAAAPAQAAVDCSVSHARNGEGSAYTEVSRPLKVGPYGDCATNGNYTGAWGKVWLHCYVYNSYSNLWWWVRIEGTSKTGWIWASHLSGVDFDDDDNGTWDYLPC